MSINDIYAKLRNYVVLAFNNHLIRIYISNQDAPRAQKPFVTINIRNISQVDRENNLSVNDAGIQQVSLQKKCIVTFQAYTDETHDSLNLLNFLQNSFYTQKPIDVFKEDIAYLRTILGVTDISTKVNNVIESRAILEVEFGLSQTISSDVGLIENIVIEQL